VYKKSRKVAGRKGEKRISSRKLFPTFLSPLSSNTNTPASLEVNMNHSVSIVLEALPVCMCEAGRSKKA
jgi:hypothetical protein